MPRVLRAILFDLDNTLYDASLGLQDAGDERITDWIVDHLGLPRREADELRRRTWREYGTTARGLEIEYGVQPARLYHETISQLEPGQYLQPWPELAQMLDSLTADCHVFTNATAVYARRVLTALGVADRFGHIFDIEHNGWVCKPHRVIYENVLQVLGLPAAVVALVEDNPRNLVPAADLGMLTVLVDGTEEDAPADLRLQSLLDLKQALDAAGIVA